MSTKYGRKVTIQEPPDGCLDMALLTCEDAEVTITQIMKELGLELLDDYLARSLAHHAAAREHAP